MKPQSLPPLHLLSVIIPARDEEGCLASTLTNLHRELERHAMREYITHAG